MVVDSSALIAMLADEPEGKAFVDLVLARDVRAVSAATILETSMVVLGRKGERGCAELERLVDKLNIEITPFTVGQLGLAIDAFRRFGRGRHPAGLNFGDCFSYALAKATGEPLLFKGHDFSQTDIKSAL